MTPTARPRLLLCSFAGAAALITVGCGGDGGTDQAQRDQFVADANELCQEADANLKRDAEVLFGGLQPTLEQRARFTRTVAADELEDLTARLRALGPPEGDEAELRAYFTAQDRLVAKLRDDPMALTPEDFGEVADAAAAYGLDECGTPEG